MWIQVRKIATCLSNTTPGSKQSVKMTGYAGNPFCVLTEQAKKHLYWYSKRYST